jgi:hypothetical protein
MIVVALDPAAVWVTDDGLAIEAIDTSRHAAIEMSDSPTTPATTITNLWQKNLVGIKVEPF